jgi:hypothetical protein
MDSTKQLKKKKKIKRIFIGEDNFQNNVSKPYFARFGRLAVLVTGVVCRACSTSI